ncbi:MAG: DoxX family protein [Gemmatimonadetes bacterium]|nr:DoxX family protein [Gemmatimonadota bacterium]
MNAIALLFLRISLGWLMVVWGVDKLTDPAHGQAVAESFYLGLGSGGTFLTVAGIFQVLVGLATVLGFLRRLTWPILAVVNGVTFVAVWKSIVDPWGFFLEGGNLVFYSSAVIFAGILVGWSAIDDDSLALDRVLKLD